MNSSISATYETCGCPLPAGRASPEETIGVDAPRRIALALEPGTTLGAEASPEGVGLER